MAVTETNITADGTTLIGTLSQQGEWVTNQVGVHAYGTFGGGTLTFQYSVDSGTTKIGLKATVGGSAISFTADEGFTWDTPLATGGAPVLLYAVLAGATSPDIDIKVIDQNRG